MLSDIATGGGLYVAIGRGTDLTSDILPHITHEMLTILICQFTSKKGELEGRMNNSTRHSYLSEYPYEKKCTYCGQVKCVVDQSWCFR